MKRLLFLNPENVSEKEIKSYTLRKAVRAIVFDGKRKIALLHVTKAKYYKLPGGGIENNEDQVSALKRECREELGSDIEVISKVGLIVEYWRMTTTKQISYCYLAKLKGKKGTPNFTKGEIKDGFKGTWLPYEEAIRAVAESNATNLEGRAYIVPRDAAFLEAVKDQLFNS